jgi:outer membrane receptor protein involved in Fe transport
MKLVPGKWVCLAFLAVALAAPSSTNAQAVYGSISGVVRDASGAVVPGVTVTITSVDRKTVDTVVTNESGRYLKERLVPGTYEVKAELTGFKSPVVPQVVVSVDTNVPIDFELQPGELSEAVEVTGGSPLLRVDRADVATRFSEKEITNLPVLDRNFTKFILLTPGTQQLQWQHAASENPQGSTQIQINGQHFSGTGYQLDGTENRDPILGIIVINPSLESIAETKITSQNYDAEFGQATAGVVSVQTKSGTNQLHGSAFEYHQDDNFQSRNPFTQFQRDPLTDRFLPKTSRNQFGASLGGPIQSDRWFFFGDYQGTRSKVGGSKLLTVPTEAARRGDLSAYNVSIFDPASSDDPNQRTPFAGGVIPADRLSPQALELLKLLPLPNAPGTENGTRNNFVASGSETFEENSFNVRVDGRLTDKLNTFGRYSMGKFFRNGPQAFGAGGGDELVTLGGVSDARNQNLAYGIDYALSNKWVADFRFGWFRYRVNVLPSDFGSTPARDAGIPGLNLDTTFTSGLPAFFMEGDRRIDFGSGLGDEVGRCNCPLNEDEQQFQFVTNWTRYLGNHSMKFGVDIRRAFNLRVPSDRHRSGELTFRPARTSGPMGGGLSLASFLLGDVSRFTRYISTSTDARERQWRQFYYAQDTWHATQKLTFNYGLRLDIINPQTLNAAGNGGFLDLETGLINVAGEGGTDLAGNIENSLNWAPRVGATYQLDDKTVIRGGYGRSYDIGVFGSLFGHTVTQNLPVLLAQENNPPDNFAAVFNLRNGPPAPVFPDSSGGSFPLPDGVFARALPKKQRPPAVDAFNITVQRQLSPDLAVEVGYVGNRGRRVFADDGPDVNPNEATLDGFLEGVSRNERRPFYSGAVRTLTFQSLGGAFGWTQDLAYYCNCAKNWYDSLQARFVKRYSHGYSVQVNYTWQRADQENSDYFFWDRTLNKGPADWERTHNFVVAGVFELPIGRGRMWLSDVSPVVDALVGGWQFNTNTFIYSGLPFSVTYRTADLDRDTGGNNRPNLVGDPKGPGTTEEWFNATPIGTAGSAFERPARGTFGTMKRNALRGPGYWRSDASLFKHFNVGGTRDLEIRIEAVNLFNTVNLGLPDTEIGVPGTPNPNAGRITSTAYGNADPMRNFQFALRFTF